MATLKDTLKKCAAIAALAVFVASVGYSIFLTMNRQTLERQVQQQTGELIALQKTLQEANSNAHTWKSKYEETSSTGLAENAELKASIEAFATQAATCAALKKKLHVVD